ncbi:MAG: SDR family NAD(P)-dependent oxidoreductase [Jatrophihabitantaceae bacterium]
MTLQDALRQAAELAPDKGTIFIRGDGSDELQTYPQLLAEAERVLAGLRATGLRPGDAALLVFDDNRGYVTAFWACVLGGFVPTPVSVATTYDTANETTRKLHNAWSLLDQPAILTDSGTAAALAGVRDLWDEPAVLIRTVSELAAHEPDHDWFATTPDSPVANLLTSGSTGVPKCVQHTNASVASRSWAAAQGRGYTSDDVSVIWMPMDHVTMLFYNVRDVFLRCLHVNGRIDHFLGNPLVWLDWLDKYRATNTWAPNFAFALINECAEQVSSGSWDLSRVRELTNGGEPVIATTSHRFLELLEPHGLPADAMAPAWGMSETCSGVTYSSQSRIDPAAGTLTVLSASLDGELQFADPAAGSSRDTVSFSVVGSPLPGVTVRIVDPDGQTLPQDQVGELQIRGVTMLHCYHANPEANRDSFDPDGWFRTGDLAFVHAGELVIAGRKKDQIVVRGANYLAHELESVVEQVPGVRTTFSAAVGLRTPGEGSDQLTVFFVPTGAEPVTQTMEQVRAVLVREVGLAPDLLIPVAEAEFPKTGSGKIQRSALVDALRAGAFADRLDTPAEQATSPAVESVFCRRDWVELGCAGDRYDRRATRLVFGTEGQLSLLGLTEDSVVLVEPGVEFSRDSRTRFTIRRGNAQDVRRVLADALAQSAAINEIIYAWGLPDRDDQDARRTGLTADFTALVRTLAEAPVGAPRLIVLTSGSVYVRAGDELDLASCMLPALLRTALTEHPQLHLRQLDLPANPIDWPAAIGQELANRQPSGVLASRDGQRWRPVLRAVPEPEAARRPPVLAGGRYLVTGGLGGIAHSLASYLVATWGVRLLLVGRSAPTGERAARLAELAELGEVSYLVADIADATAINEAVTAAEQRWGRPLDGVLHLAAADPTGQWDELDRHSLAHENQQTFQLHYQAKVTGTLVLAELLETRPDASLVLFGSVNGEFGGHSFGAYSAASSFLVGFADYWHHQRQRQVHCLAWSTWSDVGVNQDRPAEAARSRGFRSLTAEQGLRAFLTAMSLPEHYLLIGLDLSNEWILAELAPDELSADEVVLGYVTQALSTDQLRTSLAPALAEMPVPVRLVELSGISRTAKGELDQAQLLADAAPPAQRARQYVAPESELEQQMAMIWADVLGRERVGRDDSFFDLGGNSLRAARLLAKVSDDLSVRLSTHVLYQNPTVADLAAALGSAQ